MYAHECFAHRKEPIEITIEPCNEDWTLRFKTEDEEISATLSDEQLRSLKLALDVHFISQPEQIAEAV